MVTGAAGNGAASRSGAETEHLDAEVPAERGAQALAKDESSGRTVIGAVRAPAEGQTGSLKACSRSSWQSKCFLGNQPVSGRSAYGQAHACIGLVIASAAPIAVAAPGVAGCSRDGQLCRHQTALDEREAHARAERKDQEQSTRPIPMPALHATSKHDRQIPAADSHDWRDLRAVDRIFALAHRGTARRLRWPGDSRRAPCARMAADGRPP
jgi:hypothetical protein